MNTFARIAGRLLLIAALALGSSRFLGSEQATASAARAAGEESGRQAQKPKRNPFLPPTATMHYAPDRTCDLLDVAVDLDVDYPNLTCSGHVVNTMALIRDSVSSVTIQAGPALEIHRVSVDGREAKYTRQGHDLTFSLPPLPKGR